MPEAAHDENGLEVAGRKEDAPTHGRLGKRQVSRQTVGVLAFRLFDWMSRGQPPLHEGKANMRHTTGPVGAGYSLVLRF